jgi:hypothetical protein
LRAGTNSFRHYFFSFDQDVVDAVSYLFSVKIDNCQAVLRHDSPCPSFLLNKGEIFPDDFPDETDETAQKNNPLLSRYRIA